MSGPGDGPGPEAGAPPGGWRAAYTLVLAVLALTIAALAWLTERFR